MCFSLHSKILQFDKNVFLLYSVNLFEKTIILNTAIQGRDPLKQINSGVLVQVYFFEPFIEEFVVK